MNLHYFTAARWTQRWLLENFDRSAALVVPNGLDPDISHPCTPLQEKTHRPRILSEGATALPFEGVKEAFQAVQGLAIDVRCVSAYGKLQPSWRCDRFFEKIPLREMKGVYSICDILLKLSRIEGFFGQLWR